MSSSLDTATAGAWRGRHILKIGLNKLVPLFFITLWALPGMNYQAEHPWSGTQFAEVIYYLKLPFFTAKAVAIDFSLFNMGLPLPLGLNHAAEWSAVPAAGHLPCPGLVGWPCLWHTAGVAKGLHHPISPSCWAWRAASSPPCLGAG